MYVRNKKRRALLWILALGSLTLTPQATDKNHYFDGQRGSTLTDIDRIGNSHPYMCKPSVSSLKVPQEAHTEKSADEDDNSWFGSLLSTKTVNKVNNVLDNVNNTISLAQSTLVFGAQKADETLGNVNETINTVNSTILDLQKQVETITEDVSRFIRMLTFLVAITCMMSILYLLYAFVFPSLHRMSQSLRQKTETPKKISKETQQVKQRLQQKEKKKETKQRLGRPKRRRNKKKTSKRNKKKRHQKRNHPSNLNFIP